MTTLITLNIPTGGDAGPFNLYSNTNGYTVPFATGISAAALTAGYTSTVVPEGTTIIRVVSTGWCTNYIDITINLIPTTTTTSSSSTSTTTSTSTTAVPTTTTTSSSSTSTSTSTSTTTSTSTSSTTTTTTTIACDCVDYTLSISQVDLDASDDNEVYTEYINCEGDPSERISGVAGTYTICMTNAEGISPILYILVDTVPTTAIESTATKTSVCCNPTTTTTTTVCPCIEYVSIGMTAAGTFNYEDCFGTPKSIFLNEGPNLFVGLGESECVNRNSLSSSVSFTIISYGPCCTPTTTTTTTTVEPTTTTTTTVSECVEFFADGGVGGGTVNYNDCLGNPQSFTVAPEEISQTYCGLENSISDGGTTISIVGLCVA